MRRPRTPAIHPAFPLRRFGILVPAHNEEDVIEKTVTSFNKADYPVGSFEIHVVADHCSDRTALFAREGGAIVHERNEGPRSGKGAALAWLFERVLESDSTDAIVILDADTQVAPDFLRQMNSRLALGDQVVQGRHVISNPHEGWLPALVWAMFTIDNRFQNMGRANLGWSAKNMGDSICFLSHILRNLGWGEGLTDDFELRQRLLLEGIRIAYEPEALGYGEAPRSVAEATAQRMRWLRGTRESNRKYRLQLVRRWLKTREWCLLDGVLQTLIPSYSTLTMLCLGASLCHLLMGRFVAPGFPPLLLHGWLVMTGILILYPSWGLWLERAPLKAYLIILLGPLYVVWRTWLAFRARYIVRDVTWLRTPHGRAK